MIHRSLPQTKTPEALAVWITDQKKEVIVHEDQYPLTAYEIQKLEHTSAQASAALYRLKEVEDLFKEIIKGGTVVLMNDETGEPEHQPYDLTIPPTKGTKALELNRKFADDQLKQGYRVEHTNLYLIPWPEEGKMVAVDIEGNEWVEHTRDMTNFELNANKPLLKNDRKDDYTVTMSATIDGEEKSVTMTGQELAEKADKIGRTGNKKKDLNIFGEERDPNEPFI